MKLFGARISVWLVMITIGGFFLAFLETALAVSLQFLLRSLGILSTEQEIPAEFRAFEPTLTQGCIVIVIIGFLRFALQLFLHQGGCASQESINGRLRSFLMYDMLLDNSNTYMSSAKLMYHLTEVFPRTFRWCGVFVSSVGKAVEMLALLVGMLAFAWRETLIALIGSAVFAFIMFYLSRLARSVGREVLSEQKKLNRIIDRTTRNWILVKLLRTEAGEYSALEKGFSAYAGFASRGSFYGGAANGVTQFFGIVLIIIVLVLSKHLWGTSGLVLVSFLYLYLRFSQGLAGLSVQYVSLVNFMPAVTESLDYMSKWSLQDIQRMQKTIEPASFFGRSINPVQTSGVNFIGKIKPGNAEVDDRNIAPSIVFEAVSYRYLADTPIPALLNLNLDIKAGSQLGIIGPSGCGKSTVLALVLGFLKPSSGRVLVGGVGTETYFCNVERPARIGYVGPEPFLIEGSIFENLNYGAPRLFTDSECWPILERAQLANDIRNMPGQLQYQITDNGMGLSAGQKQRLSLARALLIRPELLILDEASANLDVKTEHQIALTLNDLDYECTRVIVSHRPGLIQFCDNVINLSAE